MQFRPIRETDLTGVQEVKKQFVFTPIGNPAGESHSNIPVPSVFLGQLESVLESKLQQAATSILCSC